MEEINESKNNYIISRIQDGNAILRAENEKDSKGEMEYNSDEIPKYQIIGLNNFEGVAALENLPILIYSVCCKTDINSPKLMKKRSHQKNKSEGNIDQILEEVKNNPDDDLYRQNSGPMIGRLSTDKIAEDFKR